MFETPNGAFPNYVEEQIESRQQYIDRIFGQWLEWAEGAGSQTLRNKGHIVYGNI